MKISTSGPNESSFDEVIVKFFRSIFGIRKWKIIDSVEEQISESRRYSDYTEIPGTRRNVIRTITHEICEFTGKERGYIYYGTGTYTKDQELSAQKAISLIKQIRK